MRITAVGKQDFSRVIEENCFYVDKTDFIKEWWEGLDDVTLITRPRRFGKTLTISMVEQFFSVRSAKGAELFRGLKIWDEVKFRELQGTYPVISLSFASIKESNFEHTKKKLSLLITNLYSSYEFLLDSGRITQKEKQFFNSVSMDMDCVIASMALLQLSGMLYKYYEKKVIILIDEYDTPMQEAYLYGYWDETMQLMRSLFNAAFKTNPYLERALLTGITRVSKESIFSDLESRIVFDRMVTSWFSMKHANYDAFTNALLAGDQVYMNEYLNEIAIQTFSSFDTGRKPSVFKQPENFYHGFVLGLIADLREIYTITSNRESGRGRYDVMMEPKDAKLDDGIILEFKVQESDEKCLEDTVQRALRQIVDRNYCAGLEAKGIHRKRTRIYGVAFRGKEVLLDGGFVDAYTKSLDLP